MSKVEKKTEEWTQQPQVEKKPYAAPKLSEYGSITKLTQAGLSAGGDLVGMMP